VTSNKVPGFKFVVTVIGEDATVVDEKAPITSFLELVRESCPDVIVFNGSIDL
jgi:hypothetical protein